MIIYMETLSTRMKHARSLKKWNQRQLAVACGLTPSAIGNIEAGKREAKGSIPQIAEALGVNYKWLAYGTGEMFSTKTPPLVAISANAANQNSPSGLSVHARELAEMFDLIPVGDRIKRAQVYGAAMAIIVAALESLKTSSPTHHR